MQRLAQADAGNAGRQRDLAVSYERVGNVQVTQGDLAAGAASYQASLDIRKRLAQADPGNAGWQYDLGVSYEKIGDVQMTQGNLTEALQSVRKTKRNINFPDWGGSCQHRLAARSVCFELQGWRRRDGKARIFPPHWPPIKRPSPSPNA